MNSSTAIFLINPHARAVNCIYESDANKSQTPYTFKTLDQDIKVGDLVVVPTDTRHNLTVVKVVEVDVDLDIDTPNQIKWVIGKVDLETHNDLLAMETDALAKIKASQLRKKREQLAKDLLDDHRSAIQALPISMATGISRDGVIEGAAKAATETAAGGE